MKTDLFDVPKNCNKSGAILQNALIQYEDRFWIRFAEVRETTKSIVDIKRLFAVHEFIADECDYGYFFGLVSVSNKETEHPKVKTIQYYVNLI